MKNVLLLFLVALFFSCNNAEMANKVADLEKEIVETKAQLAEAVAKSEYTPGLIHTVFFWLKEDLSAADEAAFLAGANSLRNIAAAKDVYIGPPAATEARDVVDHSFSYALILHFDDLAGQDAYQKDPIHLKFGEEHRDKWTKVQVYDHIVSK